MFVSLLAALILTAQPAPAEAPVEVEAEMEAETEVQAEVPAPAPAPAAEPAVAVEAEAEAEAEAQPPADIVCRRRLRPSNGVGRRYTTVEDCRPRSEWEAARRRR
jgi:predicted cobalt transporter CbtA